jgi:hypothetical protein
MLFSKPAFDYFSKKQFMPKLISLRGIDFHEMQVLERLAKKGTAFEARPARFILALAIPNGPHPNQIGAAHGFCAATSRNLRDGFNDMGLDGCRYQLNELANVSRRKAMAGRRLGWSGCCASISFNTGSTWPTSRVKRRCTI